MKKTIVQTSLYFLSFFAMSISTIVANSTCIYLLNQDPVPDSLSTLRRF